MPHEIRLLPPWSVEVDGEQFDFPDALTADAFLNAVGDGSDPYQSARLLRDTTKSPQPPEHLGLRHTN